MVFFMVKEKRLPVISRQMFRQAHRSFTSDAFNPNKGNPIEFDKQSTQLQLVRVDSWIPEKLMIRFTFRDTLAQGREPVKSTASILFNRPVGDVMQIIPGDVEVERVFDKELGLDSYVPVSKEIIGAVEAINGVSSNKYVFFGYLMMMGEKFTGKEKDLEGLIRDSIEEQVPLLIAEAWDNNLLYLEGLIGDSIEEQVPLLIAGAWDNLLYKDVEGLIRDSIKEQVPLLIAGAWDNNLLYKDANPVHLNVATGGDYLENLNGVRTYQGGGSVTVELSNEWSNKGKYSFKGIYGGLTSGEQISFLGHVNEALPVTPGDEKTIIINYKSINSVRLGVGWRDNNFTPVKSDYVVLPATPDGGTGSITVTAPAGVEFMIVIIVNTTTPVANTVYVDNIRIKKR